MSLGSKGQRGVADNYADILAGKVFLSGTRLRGDLKYQPTYVNVEFEDQSNMFRIREGATFETLAREASSFFGEATEECSLRDGDNAKWPKHGSVKATLGRLLHSRDSYAMGLESMSVAYATCPRAPGGRITSRECRAKQLNKSLPNARPLA